MQQVRTNLDDIQCNIVNQLCKNCTFACFPAPLLKQFSGRRETDRRRQNATWLVSQWLAGGPRPGLGLAQGRHLYRNISAKRLSLSEAERRASGEITKT